MNRLAVPLFSVCALLAACATVPDAPYSVLDGSDWDRTDPYAAPVQISRLDGMSYLNETKRTIEPGHHRIGFLTTRVVRSNKLRAEKQIEMDVEPCAHYYYYAKHESKFSTAWELKLLRKTEIEACKR